MIFSLMEIRFLVVLKLDFVKVVYEWFEGRARTIDQCKIREAKFELLNKPKKQHLVS
jgi:hypothetical protein